MLCFGQIGPVGDHDGHADRQGIECLPQGGQYCLEGHLAPVEGEHIPETLSGAGEGHRPDQQDQQQDEQGGHPDFVESFNAALYASDDDDGVDGHKDGGEQHCQPGERGRAVPVGSQHFIEVAEGIAVDGGGVHGVAEDVAQHPAAHMTVVAGDDKSPGHADPADPGAFFVPQLPEGPHDIRLTGPAHGELCKHQRHP